MAPGEGQRKDYCARFLQFNDSVITRGVCRLKNRSSLAAKNACSARFSYGHQTYTKSQSLGPALEGVPLGVSKWVSTTRYGSTIVSMNPGAQKPPRWPQETRSSYLRRGTGAAAAQAHTSAHPSRALAPHWRDREGGAGQTQNKQPAPGETLWPRRRVASAW